jgi:hypothetical protein
VGIDLRRRHVLVPQQLLNGANIGSMFQELRRKRVPVMPSSA